MKISFEVEREHKDMREKWDLKCPVCKRILMKRVYISKNYKWFRPYCPNCGWLGFQQEE